MFLCFVLSRLMRIRGNEKRHGAAVGPGHHSVIDGVALSILRLQLVGIQLTLMLLAANLADKKLCKKP